MSHILPSAFEAKEDRYDDEEELLTDLEIDEDDEDEEESEDEEDEKAKENAELARMARNLGFYKVARKLLGEDEDEENEEDEDEDDDSRQVLLPSTRGMGAVYRTLSTMGYSDES